MDDFEKYLWIKGNSLEFLRLCKINDAHKGTIAFELWQHLVEFLSIVEDNRYVMAVKAKQEGFSHALALGRALWKALTVAGWNHAFLSKGEKESIDLLKKAKFAYIHLPDWLRQVVPYEKWTETEITFPSMGSRVVALPSTETPGIGETFSEVDIDEWDFHPYPESDWATAEATTTDGGGKIVGVTTINPLEPNSIAKQKYKQAKKGENNFIPLFYGCFCRPDRDEEWYATTQKNYIGDEFDYMHKNFPRTEEEALSPISGRIFFDAKSLQLLLDSALEPRETKADNITHVYTKFQNNMVYACGADISQGVGADYQAFWILGKRGTIVEDVAIIHANDIAPSTFAYLSNELAREYNFPLLVGETNSLGLEYIRHLIDMNYPRLYEEKEGRVGWTTSDTNKERALYQLGEAIANGTLVIRYKPAILEMFDFHFVEGRDKKVKIRSVGKHDDLVMSLAIAYQMIKDLKPRGKPMKNYSLVSPVSTRGMYRV